jgi:tetratricopeptide (TPR) repeat protein
MPRPLLLAALLTFTGCAYSTAMHHGDKAAKSGDYVGALDDYQAALTKKPDSEEAQAAVVDARKRAIEGALTDAHAALESGEYEASAAALKVVERLDPDDPEAYELRKDVAAAMADERDDLWKAGDVRGAYAMAVRERLLFPATPGLDSAFEHLRTHYTTQAERLLTSARFDAALAALRTITEFEPAQKDAIAGTESRIQLAWADSLDKKAKTAARYNPGMASVLYARAYEIAGRDADLSSSHTLGVRLAADGRFTVTLATAGTSPRRSSVHDAVAMGIPAIATTDSGADLVVTITPLTPRCTESSVSTPTDRDYVSGQVEKPNPAWKDANARLEAATEAKADAIARGETLFPQVQAAEKALAHIDVALQSATTNVASYQAKFDTASTQRDASIAHREELASSTTATTAEIVSAGKRADEWSAAVDTAEEALNAAEAAVADLQSQRGPAAEELERLRAQNAEANADRVSASDAELARKADLRGISETVWEDVHANYHYAEVAWTRTCTAPVQVTMRPRWTTSETTTRTFSPSNATTDQAHAAHAASSLAADPKAFPDSDEALIAKGDAATASDIAGWISHMADDHYRVRTQETRVALAKDPVGATTSLVSLYLGAPERLDQETKVAFAAGVKAQYGLEKMELLSQP